MDETPHDGPRLNRSISNLYEACRASVDKYRKSRINREASLFKTLGSALELYRLSEETENLKEELKKLLAQNHIRITKRTTNPFTPIEKRRNANWGPIPRPGISVGVGHRFRTEVGHSATL